MTLASPRSSAGPFILWQPASKMLSPNHRGPDPHYLHPLQVGEVPRGDLVFSLNPAIDLSQVVHQFFLFGVLPKHRGHLLLQGADDVGMDLTKRGRGQPQEEPELALPVPPPDHVSETVSFIPHSKGLVR